MRVFELIELLLDFLLHLSHDLMHFEMLDVFDFGGWPGLL